MGIKEHFTPFSQIKPLFLLASSRDDCGYKSPIPALPTSVHPPLVLYCFPLSKIGRWFDVSKRYRSLICAPPQSCLIIMKVESGGSWMTVDLFSPFRGVDSGRTWWSPHVLCGSHLTTEVSSPTNHPHTHTHRHTNVKIRFSFRQEGQIETCNGWERSRPVGEQPLLQSGHWLLNQPQACIAQHKHYALLISRSPIQVHTNLSANLWCIMQVFLVTQPPPL